MERGRGSRGGRGRNRPPSGHRTPNANRPHHHSPSAQATGTREIDTLLKSCPPATELFPRVRATVELGRRNAKFLIHPIRGAVCKGGADNAEAEEEDEPPDDDGEIPYCSPRVTTSDQPKNTEVEQEEEEDAESLVLSPPSASQAFRIPYAVWHTIVEYLSDPPFSYQHKVTTYCDPRGRAKGSYLVLSTNDEALLAFSRCCRLFRHLAEREAGMFPALLNRAAFLWTMHSNKLPHDEDRASQVEELKTLLISPELWSSSALFRHLQSLRFGQQQAPGAQPVDHDLHMFLTHYGPCKETSVASDPLFVISFVLVQTLVLQKMMPPYQEKVEALARRSVFLEKLRVLLHCGFLSVEPHFAEPVVFYVVQSSVGYGNTEGEKAAILVLEELKKQGFSLNAGSLSSGLTPLHAAIRMWKVDIVEWLLENGADPENYRIWRSAGDCYTQGANVVDTVVALRKIHHTISFHLAAKLDGIVDLFVKRGYIQAT